MTTEETKKHRFEPAADTRLLYSLLSKAEIGETVTYAAMTGQLGRSVTGADSYLQSALRMIERDEEMVFASVRGVGYKRLSDRDIANTVGDNALTRIRKMSRKAAKTLTIAKDENLSNDERIKRNTGLSFMGALHHMTKPKQIEKLENAVRSSASELAIGKTLEMFKG